MTTLRTAATRTSATRTLAAKFGLEALEARALLAADPFSSVVFVADNVARPDLLSNAFPGAEIIKLDSRRDVMSQVTSALAGREGLASIQFVTHGDSGRLNLGSEGGQVLDARSLDALAGSVRSWGRALAADGDIVLWGCNIGQGSAGRAFMSKLSMLSGADVAASNNLTGSAAMNGDWTLEVKIGKVDSTASFISPSTYGFTLAAPTITGATAGQTVNENNNIRPFNSVVIAYSDPAANLSVSVSLDSAAKGTFTAASLALSGFSSAGGGVYTFSGTAAAATFALARLNFDPTDNRVDTGSTETTTFTISASDGIVAAATNNTTTVISTAINDAPTITGTLAGQAVNDNATVSPFSAVTIGDADSPTQMVTVTVSLDNAAKGAFTGGSLTTSGFTASGNGVYAFTGTAADATTAIRALVFAPTANRVAVGSAETTTLEIGVNDGVAAETCDGGTTVVSTSVNDISSIGGASAGQAVNDNATVSVFSGLTISDPDAAQLVLVTVELDSAAKGVFTTASLTASGFVSQGGGQYTFSGTAAQAQVAIRQLVFAPTANRVAVGSTETTTFSVTASDTLSGVTNTTTTAVSTSINDAPTLSAGSAGQAVNDNATVSPFSGFTITDVDPGQTVGVSVTLDTAAKGVFTSASLTASGFASAGGGVYTFSGTAAAATTAIRALVFDPTDNRVAPGATETSTFTVSVDDGVAAAATDNATTVISTSVNDAPTFSGTSAGQAVNDTAFVSPFSAVTIGDLDNPAQTLTVTVTLDTAAKGLFTSASLTASGFTDMGSGVYSFSGTAAAATTAIQALSFDPANNRVAPGLTETTTFSIAANDGTTTSTNTATTVVSASVNDAPSITGTSAGQAVNDNSSLSPFSAVTIADADVGQSVSVTITLDTAAKGLFTSASLTTSGFTDMGSGVYSFTGSTAAATTAIRALVFDPTDNRVAVASTETTTFSIAISDTVAMATDSTTTVVSTSVNDAPSITGSSAGQAVNDTATVSPFSAVTISDVDPSQTIGVSVTLDTAAKGSFTGASLTASGFASMGGGVYTFSGSASAATTAIRALVFSPTANRVGPGATETTTFTISVDDGVAAAVTDSATTVVSTGVNDAPSISGTSAAQSVNDNATIQPFSGVTIADVDPGQTLSVSIGLDPVAGGAFTGASLTSSGFTDLGGGVYNFSGTASAATTAIRALVFAPTANRVAPGASETNTFGIVVSDGVAANVSNSTTTVISNGVNDAPSITGTSSGQTVNDNATLSPFSAVSVIDLDPNQPLNVTVTIDDETKGAFTAGSLTASGFTDLGGGDFFFSGTAAQATTAIRALVFSPTANRVAVGTTETSSFTIVATDGIAAAANDMTTSVVSLSINDAATFSGSSANQAVNDNATISPFTGFTISDLDSPAQTLAVQVVVNSSAAGVFTNASLTTSGFTSMGSGVYAFNGTASAATTAIRALVFDPTDNRVNPTLTESITLVVLVNDGVVSSTTDGNSVVSTSVNDAPSASGFSAGQAVDDNATLSPFSAVTISDADTAQTLSVSVTLDTAAKGIFTSDSLTTSGFVSMGSGVYTFSGTAAQATTAIRALVFAPTANRVTPGATETTTFAVAISDAIAATVSSSTTTVVSTSINDAPVLSGVAAAQAVNDNAFVSPFSSVTVTDPDMGSQTLTVSVTLDSSAKGVFTTASLATSGFIDMGGGSYTYIGNAAQVTAALRALSFDPTDNRVTIGSTETSTFQLFISDGVAPAVLDTTTTVVSTSVNDVSTITGASAGQAVTDITTVSPFTAITIADNDSPAQTLTVTVTLDNASKGLFTSDSLTASGFVDSGGGVYTFTGTAANATTAIRALVFNPADNRVTPNATETTTFSIAVNDGFTTTTDATSTVVSTSINDATTISTGVAGQEADDGAAITPSSGSTTVNPFAEFSVTDADTFQDLTVTVTLDDAAKGVFSSGSLLSSGFVSMGGGVYTFIGTAEEATNAIRQLAFDPTNNRVLPGQTETSTFTVSVSDGLGAPVTDNNTTVVSTSINDAPILTGASAGQAVNENATRAPFASFVVFDFDEAQNITLTVTLDNASKGVFTSDSLTASGFSLSAPGVYTFTGIASQATDAIRALVFNPADNRVAIGSTETTTFTVSASDALASPVTSNTTTVVSTSINDAPVVTTVTSNPTTVLRQQSITITASGITDADNTATSVEFYRDANGNGTFDAGIDTLLGTANISNGTATRSFSTTTFGAGVNTFFVRAKDSLNLWGTAATGTGTVTNRTPTLSSLTRSNDPVVNVGDNLTLTASSVADADGTVARVQFYRDADGDNQFDANIDTFLGEDTSATGGYKLTFATTGFPTGTNRYYARVVDNDGGTSSVATVTGRVNAAPTFSTFTSSVASVNRKTSFALSATGAADTDGTINRMEFYRDSNGNGTFDAGTDALIGTDSSASAGTYTLNVATASYAAGDNTFFSRAKDNNGAFSAVRTTVVTINNLAPTVASLSRSPAIVTTLGNNLTLTAGSAADADGTIASVQFYRDTDGDGSFDANIDTLIGTDVSSTGGYALTVATNFFTVGVNRFFARTVDSDGATSSVVTTTATINAAPTIASLTASPSPISRASTFTLSANTVADSDGTIRDVLFYRDRGTLGSFNSSEDSYLGTGTLVGGVYRITLNGSSLALGTHTFFTRARDNNGAFSAVQSVTVTVVA